jgi:hypothetical protein
MSRSPVAQAGGILCRRATVGKAKGGGDKKSDHRVSRKPTDPPTLDEAGIDKNGTSVARLGAL